LIATSKIKSLNGGQKWLKLGASQSEATDMIKWFLIILMRDPLLNPQCRHCGEATKRNKTLASGLVRYQCKACGKYTTPCAQHGGHNKIEDGLTAQQRWNRANQAYLSELQRDRRSREKDQKPLDM
jgi:rRNA maturation protein Nop10